MVVRLHAYHRVRVPHGMELLVGVVRRVSVGKHHVVVWDMRTRFRGPRLHHRRSVRRGAFELFLDSFAY